MKIFILGGPNLNMLGVREPTVYGSSTLDDIHSQIVAKYPDVEFTFFQTNHEGALIDMLHKAHIDAAGVVLNAAAFTHYSYGIRDAIAAISPPVIEVHLSNVHARDEFRHTSVIAPVCNGQICGLGINSYLLAVQYLIEATR